MQWRMLPSGKSNEFKTAESSFVDSTRRTLLSRNYQIVQFAGTYNENTCGAQNGLSGNSVNIELHRVRMNEEFDIERQPRWQRIKILVIFAILLKFPAKFLSKKRLQAIENCQSSDTRASLESIIQQPNMTSIVKISSENSNFGYGQRMNC